MSSPITKDLQFAGNFLSIGRKDDFFLTESMIRKIILLVVRFEHIFGGGMSDPYARLAVTERESIMATKYPNLKRKTPCASVKGSLLNPATTSVWCNCCGEWEMGRMGKPVRYIERKY